MARDRNQPTTEQLLSPDRLAPSAAILGAHIALTAALGTDKVVGCDHDQRTVDLLLRLYLSPGRSARAVDLGRQLLVSPSHTSRLIDRVEALGLVERSPDPDDRRANRVGLTGEGLAVIAQIAPHLAAVLDEVVHDSLDPDEIQTLISLLERVEHAARRSSAARALDQP